MNYANFRKEYNSDSERTHSRKINRITLLIVIIIPGIIGILCLTTGYLVNKNNSNFVESICHVNSYKIETDSCSESCGCGGGSCHVCTFPCYNIFVVVSVNRIEGAMNSATVLIASKRYTVYPTYPRFTINSNLTCYYNKNNISEVRFDLREVTLPFMFGIVLCAIAGFGLTFLIILEISYIGITIYTLTKLHETNGDTSHTSKKVQIEELNVV